MLRSFLRRNPAVLAGIPIGQIAGERRDRAAVGAIFWRRGTATKGFRFELRALSRRLALRLLRRAAPQIDDLGEELHDCKAAWETAVHYAADSLRDPEGKLCPNAEWRLDVLSDRKALLFQITVVARLPAGDL